MSLTSSAAKKAQKKNRKAKKTARKDRRKVIDKTIKADRSRRKAKLSMDPASMIFKAVARDEMDKGCVVLEPGSAPTQDASTETPRMSNNQNQFLVIAWMNQILNRTGAPTPDNLANQVDWANLAALIANLISEAAKDNVLELDKMPASMLYFLRCMGPKVNQQKSGKTINSTWNPTTIPPKIPDGAPVPPVTGFLPVGLFLNGGVAIGNIAGIGNVSSTSQLAAGNFSTLTPTSGVYNEARALSDFNVLCTFLTRSPFTRETKSAFGSLDPDSVTDAFNQVEDPTWISVPGTSYGFQQNIFVNGKIRDLAIAECKCTQPITALTPDPRTPPDAKMVTGTPLVGHTNLLLSEMYPKFKDRRQITLRPAPFRFADLLNTGLKIWALQLKELYGPLLVGFTGQLNTLEIVTVFYNLIIPFFADSSAYAGSVFPAVSGRPNEFGSAIDMKNYPNMASSNIYFNAIFSEWLRQTPSMTFVKMVEEKGVKILRVPTLVIDPTQDYTLNVRAVLIGAGLDPVIVPATFLDAPAVATVGRLWGKIEFLTCSWASTSASPAVVQVNVTQGGIVQALFAKWNLIQADLSAVGMIQSGRVISEATGNRVLQILVGAEDDYPDNPVTGDASRLLQLMSEEDLKKSAADMGAALDRHLMRIWFELRPNPSVFAGVVGLTTYAPSNYTQGWGFPITIQTGGESDEVKAITIATGAAARPTAGLPGSESSMSNLVILFQMRGGGFTYSTSQLKILDHMIENPPGDLGVIVKAMEREGFPLPAIRGVMRSKSVAQAIQKLKGRKVWNSFKEGLKKVGGGLLDAAKKILPDLLGF